MDLTQRFERPAPIPLSVDKHSQAMRRADAEHLREDVESDRIRKELRRAEKQACRDLLATYPIGSREREDCIAWWRDLTGEDWTE